MGSMVEGTSEQLVGHAVQQMRVESPPGQVVGQQAGSPNANACKLLIGDFNLELNFYLSKIDLN